MKTLIEMIEVMQAAKEGKDIECNIHGNWEVIDKPHWNWAVYDYRVKPAEPMMFYAVVTFDDYVVGVFKEERIAISNANRRGDNPRVLKMVEVRE